MNDKDIRIVHQELLKKYKLDYCSMFISSGSEFLLKASNVNSKYHSEILEYISETIIKMEYDSQIKTSKTFLSYANDRNIKFSFIIIVKLSNEMVAIVLIENKDSSKWDNDKVKDIYKHTLMSIKSYNEKGK